MLPINHIIEKDVKVTSRDIEIDKIMDLTNMKIDISNRDDKIDEIKIEYHYNEIIVRVKVKSRNSLSYYTELRVKQDDKANEKILDFLNYKFDLNITYQLKTCKHIRYFNSKKEIVASFQVKSLSNRVFINNSLWLIRKDYLGGFNPTHWDELDVYLRKMYKDDMFTAEVVDDYYRGD